MPGSRLRQGFAGALGARPPKLDCGGGKSGHDERVPPLVCEQKAAVTRSRAAAASVFQILLLVADAIDRAGPVVGDEDGSILVHDDVIGPTEIALLAFDPAGCKDFLLGILAVGIDDHA